MTKILTNSTLSSFLVLVPRFHSLNLRAHLFSAYLVLFILLVTSSLQAQQYSFTASSGTFTPITVDTVSVDEIEVDDNLSAGIPIGFDFEYFGTPFDSLKASSNGWLTFDLNRTDNLLTNTINSSAPVIAPLWDDLGGHEGEVHYSTTGSTPNRVFTIEFLNWRWRYFQSPPAISFQVKLYETDNRIEFIYRQEAGNVGSGSASIGLVGNVTGVFYSLANTSTSPILDPNGQNRISVRPATGQIYTFAPSSVPATVPTVQASNITTTSLGSGTMRIKWTNGDGAYRIVAMKETAITTDSTTLSDSVNYRASTNFRSGQYLGSLWYTVYNGAADSVDVRNLEDGYSYQIQVLEYNGIALTQRFLNIKGTGNPANSTLPVSAPTGTVSTMTPKNVTDTRVVFNLLEGDGTRRAIFMKDTTAGLPPVADSVFYAPSTSFGSGTQIGTSGWYCIFNNFNTGNWTVTGLSPDTEYRIVAVEYNGGPGVENYQLADTVAGNPIQMKTFSPFTDPDYTLTSTISTFQPLTGGTPLDTIEEDSRLSDFIPIGFEFDFGGVPFAELKASSEGYLTLNPYETNPERNNNLRSSYARPIIAPLWDDLSGSVGQASYATTGSPGDRVFTFEWLGWKWRSSASDTTISFQVKLYEANGIIEYIYRPEAGSVWSPSASIGIAYPAINATNFLSLNNFTDSATVSNSSETTSINIKPVEGLTYTFTPNLSQTIAFGAIPNKFYGDAPFALGATASSGLDVSYTSSDTTVATVFGNMVTVVGLGSTTITASQAGDAIYNPAVDVMQTLTVNKGNQVISFDPLPIKGDTDPTFILNATVNSGLPISYTSSDLAVATISGSTVTITGQGTTTITASQAGNANYNAAVDVMQDLIVRTGQIITFGALPTKNYGDASFSISATSNSGLGVSFSSSDNAVATISGTNVTITGGGTVTITATQDGNGTYAPAPPVDQLLTVNKIDQTITFGALVTKTLGDNDFTLDATASSGLTVSYASSNTSVATVSANTVTIVGAGSTTITASQPGDANYNAATAVDQTLTVNKADQTITFGALDSKVFGDSTFALGAIASSALAVSYSSSNTSVATVSGNMLTIVGAGSATITAAQLGNANYNPASNVNQILTVNKADQSITFNNIADKVYGDLPFTLDASSTSSLPVAFSVVSGQLTLSGNEVTINGAGSSTIRAAQSGNDNYNAANSVDISFCIIPAKPTISINGQTLTSSSDVGNQWYFNNVAISAATSATYVPAENGNYSVEVTIEGCGPGERSEPLAYVVTGINSEVSYNVEVFPNPVKDEINLTYPIKWSGERAEIYINDLNGRTVERRLIKMTNGLITVNIEDLLPGQYYLIVKSIHLDHKERIIKQ